jgi:subtilisin family serine protease
MARLDAELELLLVRKEIFDKDPSAARLDVEPDELIPVSVVFSGDITALEQAGLQVSSASARIAYGAITLTHLQALAALSQVVSIERQRHPHPHLNDSVPDIKANKVWNIVGDSFQGYTGRGVIVGIIDTGIDITHPNFRKADNSTRVVAIWDQTLTAQGGDSAPGAITDPNLVLGALPTPLGYGVEYDEGQINDTLNSSSPPVKVRHIDEDGHGTHVAGIAAGNGSKRGGCLLKYQYVGVAPEADIVMVRLFGLSKSDGNQTAPPTNNGYLPDAIRYILNTAKNKNQAAVINASLGRFTEFMDGTSASSQDFDALLNANSKGRAIIFSAGNEADGKFHASATVPAGSGSGTPLALNFTISDGDTAVASRTLMVMYSGSNLQAQVTSSTVPGPAGVVAWVSAGANGSSTTANGPNGMVTVSNAANRITISISSTQASAGPPRKYNGLIAGTWKLELRDTANTATPIDAYCLYGSSHDQKSPRFLTNTTTRSTLDEYASGHETLAVGSCKVGGDLSDFSARGPTLDARTKPDLCAPGDSITSAHSGAIVDDPDCFICCCSCCEAYVDKGGTSMAAPHIAGVIALMLHRDPNLKHDEITKALTANAAAKPSGTSPDDDLGWGAGRVDADETMTSTAVEAVNPPVFAEAASPIVAEAPPQAEPALALRDELLATERGAELSQLFEQHAREVWTLINTNRRVATVWHRCKGPIWVRLSLRAVHSPALPLPMRVDDLTLQQATTRFARVMWRYASAPLRRDLQTYLPQLSLLREGMGLSDLIQAAGKNRALAGADPSPALA